MTNYNKVMLVGRLCRDVELRENDRGVPWASTGIAVNKKWKEGDEEVLFIDVKFNGDRARNLFKFFKKGDPILVEGRLKLEQWVTKEDGKKCSKHVVVGDNWEFMGTKREQHGAGADAQRETGSASRGDTRGDDPDRPF